MHPFRDRASCRVRKIRARRRRELGFASRCSADYARQKSLHPCGICEAPGAARRYGAFEAYECKTTLDDRPRVLPAQLTTLPVRTARVRDARNCASAARDCVAETVVPAAQAAADRSGIASSGLLSIAA